MILKSLPKLCRIQLRTLSTGEKHPLAESTVVVMEPERNLAFYFIRVCGDYVGILGRNIGHGWNELVVWGWKTGVQNLRVLSTTVQSFVFLDDKFILGSSWAPPALLVYRLRQGPRNDTAQTSTHFLRFLLGTRFQGSQGTSPIILASHPSPGWLPSAMQVPFHIAGDERMIAMYSQVFAFRGGQTFLIPANALLRQISSLPPEEGLDVEWEVHGPQHIEPVPEHKIWDNSFPYFMFGMRHVLPEVLNLDGKSSILIRDLSPRRCLRASNEEREESYALYEAITACTTRRTGTPNLRLHSILKCVPLPENIIPRSSLRFLMSEDGIVILENGTAVGGPAVLHMLTI